MSSLLSRTLRPLTAFAALAACAAVQAPAASAAPVSISLNYTCSFPLMLPQPVKVTITSDIPATIGAGQFTEAFPLDARAEVNAMAARGLVAVETATLEGTAAAESTIVRPGTTPLSLTVNTAIAKTTLPATGGFTTDAKGETPPIQFRNAGRAAIQVNDLVLSLSPRLADGLPTGLDTFETECAQDPGQNRELASIIVTAAGGDTVAPSVPAGLVGTPSDNAVSLTWAAANDNVGVTAYDVYRDGTLVTTVSSPAATVSGLTSDTEYRFTVRARDAAGNASAQSAATVTRTTKPNTGATYAWNVSGAAALKTLTKGSVPQSGTFGLSIAADGTASGDLALAESQASLVALGFLPVSARLAFVQTAPTTGTLSGGVLTTVSKMRIKLPKVSAFGVELAGGANCQGKQVSGVNLKSTSPGFDPARGGTVAGTFAISDLTGCGFLNNIVSPLTAGSGNVLTLNLVPSATR